MQVYRKLLGRGLLLVLGVLLVYTGIAGWVRLVWKRVAGTSSPPSFVTDCHGSAGNATTGGCLLLQESRGLDELGRKDYTEGCSVDSYNNTFPKSLDGCNVLFFNRVPKTGSEMFVLLLQWLQGQNGFRHIRLRNTQRRHLTPQEQTEMVETLTAKKQEAEVPKVSFDRHVYFTNLDALGLEKSVYFNLVRDPIEKLASRFYYARVTPRPGAPTPQNYIPKKLPRYSSLEECVLDGDLECTFRTGQRRDLTIPYFCGHEEYCRELNNIAALSEAKRTVEEWYPVVGVLEDLNATFEVLEAVLPQFFAGVSDLFYTELNALHHNKNRQRPDFVEPEVARILKDALLCEYDFYFFIKQRLQMQVTNLRMRRGSY